MAGGDTPTMLQKEFESLLEMPSVGNVSARQRIEMRRMFFAGARSYSNLLLRYASPGDELTPTDEALVEALEAELQAFFVDVAAGRA